MKGSLRTLVTVGSAVAVSGLALAGSGDGQLLYDIDFSEPFHTFGDFVSLDTGAAPRQGFSGYFLTDPADEAVVDGVFDLRSMTEAVERRCVCRVLYAESIPGPPATGTPQGARGWVGAAVGPLVCTLTCVLPPPPTWQRQGSR